MSDKYKDQDNNKASKILFDKCGVSYKPLGDVDTKEVTIRLEK